MTKFDIVLILLEGLTSLKVFTLPLPYQANASYILVEETR
jgi:hypothetical protein